MKTILLLTAAIVLASCASNSGSEFPTFANSDAVIQNIRFIGPINEQFPEQRQNKNINVSKPLVSGDQLFQFPLTQSVQCNRENTECRHAVVNAWLEFNANIQPNENIVITGVLHSEFGRSFSVETKVSSGYSQAESLSLPESVLLIGEAKSDLPFQKSLKRGEVLELKGLADVQVFLQFQ